MITARVPDPTLPDRLESVAVVVPQNCAPFELGVLCEVFGTDRSEAGLPVYDFAVCSSRTGPIDSRCGFTLQVEHGLDRVATADLVAIPAYHGDRPDSSFTDTAAGLTPEELDAVRAAHARGALVLSVCSGASRWPRPACSTGGWCTTHWRHTDELAAAHRRAVAPNVLYVVDDRVLTSAGTAAGIDLCLHLVREIQGTRWPTRSPGGWSCRRTATAARRSTSHCPCPSRATARWPTSGVDERPPRGRAHGRRAGRPGLDVVADLRPPVPGRDRHHPHRWLVRQRVLRAQHLLESSDEPIERVAQLSGFGNAANLRHHFALVRGTTPLAFRRTFRPAS